MDNLKKLEAVECVSCMCLHKYSSSGWITLYAKWEQPQLAPTLGRRDLQPKHGGAGSSDNPVIVCDDNTCILRAMARLNPDGDY